MRAIKTAILFFLFAISGQGVAALAPPPQMIDVVYEDGSKMHLRESNEILCEVFIVINGYKMSIPSTELSQVKRPMLEDAKFYADMKDSRVVAAQVLIPTYDPDDGSPQRTAMLVFDSNGFVELTDLAGGSWTLNEDHDS